MKVPVEGQYKEERVKRYWEKTTGIKVGSEVEFKVAVIEPKEGGGQKKILKNKTGVLKKYYQNVALFEFGSIRRCIQNHLLTSYLNGTETLEL